MRIECHLPPDLIRKAKIYAAERDTSINQLVRDLLEETVSRQDRIEKATARILAMAKRGPHFTKDPGSKRR